MCKAMLLDHPSRHNTRGLEGCSNIRGWKKSQRHPNQSNRAEVLRDSCFKCSSQVLHFNDPGLLNSEIPAAHANHDHMVPRQILSYAFPTARRMNQMYDSQAVRVVDRAMVLRASVEWVAYGASWLNTC